MNPIFYSKINDNELVDGIRKGSIGVLPTDTVYGVVASVNIPNAVTELYRLKNRDKKPGTVIAANVDQLLQLGVNKKHVDLASRYWPNPISIVLPVDSSLDYLSQGIGSLAFRIVADEGLREFLEDTGPLLTSSANDPGEPTATTVEMAKDYFQNKVAFYVDGGAKSDNPSTVIRFTDNGVEIIRQGVFKF
jgi:tRNA threonylcarbamoyl adenosine modification protein (Sua5/YciO/YrdC/YwlC family)